MSKTQKGIAGILVLPVVAVTVLTGLLISYQPTPKPIIPAVPPPPTAAGIAVLINQQRVQHSEQPLIDSPYLDQSASDKCQDMLKYNYYSHNSPQGKTWQSFINAVHPEFSYIGENIDYSEPTSPKVVMAWMNSPEHRANILRSSYVYVGYAVCHSPTYNSGIAGAEDEYLDVQQFATP